MLEVAREFSENRQTLFEITVFQEKILPKPQKGSINNKFCLNVGFVFRPLWAFI